ILFNNIILSVSEILDYYLRHTGLMSKNYQDEQTNDEDAKAYNEEDNNNYSTSTDSPAPYSQNHLNVRRIYRAMWKIVIIFYFIHLGILTANVRFENCYDDKKSKIFDDDFIVDSLFDINDTESKIELEIAKYICQANLDKTKTNQLLTLLNHVHDQRQLPPSSSIDL
ncbi:unnamed protein product, partial [Didymodactylos carnosus]